MSSNGISPGCRQVEREMRLGQLDGEKGREGRKRSEGTGQWIESRNRSILLELNFPPELAKLKVNAKGILVASRSNNEVLLAVGEEGLASEDAGDVWVGKCFCFGRRSEGRVALGRGIGWAEVESPGTTSILRVRGERELSSEGAGGSSVRRRGISSEIPKERGRHPDEG